MPLTQMFEQICSCILNSDTMRVLQVLVVKTLIKTGLECTGVLLCRERKHSNKYTICKLKFHHHAGHCPQVLGGRNIHCIKGIHL